MTAIVSIANAAGRHAGVARGFRRGGYWDEHEIAEWLAEPRSAAARVPIAQRD